MLLPNCRISTTRSLGHSASSLSAPSSRRRSVSRARRVDAMHVFDNKLRGSGECGFPWRFHCTTKTMPITVCVSRQSGVWPVWGSMCRAAAILVGQVVSTLGIGNCKSVFALLFLCPCLLTFISSLGYFPPPGVTGVEGGRQRDFRKPGGEDVSSRMLDVEG